MGTLIQDAAEVATCATAIDAAIAAKGATTAGGLRNAAAAIATIQTGATVTSLSVTANGTYTAPTGTGYTPVTVDVTEYVPLPSAPNIRTTLANHAASSGYNFRGIFLYDIGTTTATLSGGVNLWCDDGGTISGTTVTWTDATTYHWVICASDNPFTFSSINHANLLQVHGDASRASESKYGIKVTSAYNLFRNCTKLVSVTGSVDLSACTSASGMFQGCSSLTAVPSTLDLSACTSATYMFYGCSALTAVPSTLDLSSCTSAIDMFNYCSALTAVPSTLDLSACTSATYMFNYCSALRSLPTNMTFPDYAGNYTFTFASATNVSAASFCTFAADGTTISGGMVYNMNDVKTQYSGTYTRTIQLPSTLKSYFTSAQRTIIISHCNTLGYTLTNFTA